MKNEILSTYRSHQQMKSNGETDKTGHAYRHFLKNHCLNQSGLDSILDLMLEVRHIDDPVELEERQRFIGETIEILALFLKNNLCQEICDIIESMPEIGYQSTAARQFMEDGALAFADA